MDASLSNIDKTFHKVQLSTNKLSNAFGVGTKSTSLFRKALGTLSGIAIGKALADATKEGISYYETVNLFNVAMKDSIDEGKAFIDMMSEMYGLDPKSLMDYTGLFYEMAYAVDVPQKAAEKLSTSLTALTVDLASLFNFDIDTTADNLMSGMRGMSRSVLKYGMDLRATTVEAYANAKGITAQFETMNEASREILRFLVILEQAQDAQGDFADTLESPANQLRVFKEQAAQLGRAISRFIISPLGAALPVINGFVAALRIMIDTLATLFGFDYDFGSIRDAGGDADDAADSVAGIGSAADKTASKLKKMMAPFDELNVISESASAAGAGSDISVGAIDPKILELLDQAEYKLNEVRLKAWDTRDAILAFFGFQPDGNSWIYAPDVFEKNLKRSFDGWTQTIEALFNFDYGYLTMQLRLMADTLLEIAGFSLQNVVSDVLALFGIEITDSSLAKWIDELNGKLFDFRHWLVDNKDEIVEWTTRILELGLAFAAFSTIVGIITPVVAAIAGIGKALFFVVTAVTTLAVGFQALLGSMNLASNFIALVLSVQLMGFKNFVVSIFVGALDSIATFVVGFIAGFAQLWSTSEQFRENIKTIFSNIGTLILGIVDVFKNMINAVVAIVGPFITVLGNLFQPFVIFVTDIVNNVIGVFIGFVDIINGILTLDLTKVFKGFGKILLGLFNSVGKLAVGIVNTMLSIIVSAINFLGTCVYEVCSFFVGIANGILSAIGMDTITLDRNNFIINDGFQIVMPNIDYAFANGGVVTGPTYSLIGEAGRAEAVMPLDDSPQMYEFIDRIVDRIGNAGETVVKVYIGDKEWDAFTYQSAQRGKDLVGAQPIKESST